MSPSHYCTWLVSKPVFIIERGQHQRNSTHGWLWSSHMHTNETCMYTHTKKIVKASRKKHQVIYKGSYMRENVDFFNRIFLQILFFYFWDYNIVKSFLPFLSSLQIFPYISSCSLLNSWPLFSPQLTPVSSSTETFKTMRDNVFCKALVNPDYCPQQIDHNWKRSFLWCDLKNSWPLG